ncbi:SPPL3 [Symbiodinium natans]|uniref:SPPL3 protein n=1 Tax=Symbiodinium natans TaxID=878477 RepID=A0A812RIQ6_9DINO|nr:SPPL3 [Symbiodinium natans]
MSRPYKKVQIFAVAIGKSMGDKAGTFFSTADMRQTGFGSAIAPQAEEVQEVDTLMAGSFCIVGSAMLVFLFFFMKYMIYVIMFSFCVGGALCLAQFIAMSLHHYVPRLKQRVVDLPLLGPVTEAECIAAAPAVTLAVCWFVLRNTKYGWPFQDIIGAGFLCWMQRTLRLPNLKTASVLLVAMFFFDIYWVFISVHQFKQSVMVSVATGAGTGETVPMLIRIPQFGDPLGGDRMLGFGDIALPGLLVSYLRRHDLTSHRTFWEGYFAPSLLGYFCGLCATIVALSIMKMGQPALLYLVPGTLGTTVVLSLCRGELQLLWEGLPARGSRRLEDCCCSASMRSEMLRSGRRAVPTVPGPESTQAIRNIRGTEVLHVLPIQASSPVAQDVP